MQVELPKICSSIRKLEKVLKFSLETKLLAESNPLLFDQEDIEALNAAINSSRESLTNHAKTMLLPNTLVHAATFAEQVNARLPIVSQIRCIGNDELSNYFDSKQRRLALQAQEMLQMSLKENVGPL